LEPVRAWNCSHETFFRVQAAGSAGIAAGISREFTARDAFAAGAVRPRRKKSVSMNSIAYFEIQSSCVEREARFYTAAFGWKIEKDASMPIAYYRIEADGIGGALLERPLPAVSMSGTNAFTCSIEVEDFDKTAGIILAHGGAVALPKFAVPGKCWHGYFLDPDNNVFGIFQVDENAQT
jgi:predicted enzyme related to lactoylglutathione lyase